VNPASKILDLIEMEDISINTTSLNASDLDSKLNVGNPKENQKGHTNEVHLKQILPEGLTKRAVIR
jgi:hypothetical protein